MLMTKERRSAIRTLRGWAISVLQGGLSDALSPKSTILRFQVAILGRTFVAC
jgi:hypothetical protein